MPDTERFPYGIGQRRNRFAAHPHWCELWPKCAEAAAKELGFEFKHVDGRIRFRSAEQRDQVVEKADVAWRNDRQA
jgi:hypothetical protein